jgi:hypothetical protein
LWGSQFCFVTGALQPPFRRLLLIALSALSLAAAASLVPTSNFKEVETETNARFAGEPWDLLGDARGSYIPGCGAIFTFELSLVSVPPLNPFKLTVTPQEVRGIHDRKIKQLAVLKTEMQDLVVKAASSLASMPPGEQIIFEARLLNRSFEDSRGLPNRLIMTANRQKLLDAVAQHATPAGIAALIAEREE